MTHSTKTRARMICDRGYYSVWSRENGQRAEIYIYGDIVTEKWDDTDVEPTEFLADLKEISAPDIDLRVNSRGGSFFAANLIYTALKQHPARVHGHVDSLAASAAAHVMMACDSVSIAETGTMMIHSPWTTMLVQGNAADIERESQSVLGMLRAVETAATRALMTRWNGSESELRDAMAAETWYSADDAVAAGLADEIYPELGVAVQANAELPILARTIDNLTDGLIAMTQKATPTPAPAPIEPDAAEAQKAFRAEESARRAQIAKAFSPFKDTYVDLMLECQNDFDCTPTMASAKLLAKIGEDQAPAMAGSVELVVDERDNFLQGVETALLVRATHLPREQNINNAYAGITLGGIAMEVCRRNGKTIRNAADAVRLQLNQDSTDFTVALENALHKMALTAYNRQTPAYPRFCRIGTVNDFRAHNRLQVGSLPVLPTVAENAVFTALSQADAAKETITAVTKGGLVEISRAALVNDDLDLIRVKAEEAGAAAARTVDTALFALFSLNTNAGPTMTDTDPLWHANHSNLGTGGANSITTWNEARSLMAAQQTADGNAYLDIRPAVWVGPVAQAGLAMQLNESTADPTASGNSGVANYVAGMVQDIVGTPYLTGNPYYFFADPMLAPVFEVAFLNGMQEPYFETEDPFTYDGVRWKIRLDVGVAAIGWQGVVKNVGA